MRPIRIHETNHNFLLDRRLSYKARGVLAYIFEHKGQWDVHVETLINGSEEDGRVSVQSAMQELLKWQYAQLVLVRDPSGKVKGREYNVYDVPLDRQPSRRAENLSVGCPHCDQAQESHVDPCTVRQAGNLSVGTDVHKTRQSENLSVGTDKQETRRSGNLSVGKSGIIGVDTEDHRQAGFPMIVKPDDQETCSITNSLKNKTKDQPQDLPPTPQGESVSVRRRTKASQLPNTDYTPGFNKAWALYPRKEKKVDTFTIWRERGLEARAAEIAEKIARLQVTLWAHKELRFIPLPTTWFNEFRYEDDLVSLDVARQLHAREQLGAKEYKTAHAGQRFVERINGEDRRPGLCDPDGDVIDDVQYRID